MLLRKRFCLLGSRFLSCSRCLPLSMFFMFFLSIYIYTWEIVLLLYSSVSAGFLRCLFIRLSSTSLPPSISISISLGYYTVFNVLFSFSLSIFFFRSLFYLSLSFPLLISVSGLPRLSLTRP